MITLGSESAVIYHMESEILFFMYLKRTIQIGPIDDIQGLDGLDMMNKKLN